MRNLKQTIRIVNDAAREFFFWPRELREIYITLPANGVNILSACRSLDFEYEEIVEMITDDKTRIAELENDSESFEERVGEWARRNRKYPSSQRYGLISVEELETLHFTLLKQVTNIRRVRKGDERVLGEIFDTPKLKPSNEEDAPGSDSGLGLDI